MILSTDAIDFREVDSEDPLYCQAIGMSVNAFWT